MFASVTILVILRYKKCVVIITVLWLSTLHYDVCFCYHYLMILCYKNICCNYYLWLTPHAQGSGTRGVSQHVHQGEGARHQAKSQSNCNENQYH
jgi:hypothetical protein